MAKLIVNLTLGLIICNPSYQPRANCLDQAGTLEDPLLDAGLFEGDIANTSYEEISNPDERNLVMSHQTWPDKLIPYFIGNDYSASEKTVIYEAMEEIHIHSCVRFTPRIHQKSYVHIFKGNGCSSDVGLMPAGQQPQGISLGRDGCLQKGIVLHELLHTVGFWHEQSREDRDSFIKIHWNKLKKQSENNFQKYKWGTIRNLSETYDYVSLMHYGPRYFSEDKHSVTVEPLREFKSDLYMGQRIRMTEVDIRKLNKLYNCKVSNYN